jgi:hypothetical protein
VIIGCAFFFLGWHNIDNAWNLHYVNKNFCLNLSDSNFHGYLFGEEELYKNGVAMLLLGFFIAVLGAFSLAKAIKTSDAIGKA